MKSLKKIIWNILRIMRLGGIVQLALKSGLTEDGWFLSYYKKQSVDANGEPIPWITYPAKKFIENRLNSDMEVFEYGAGNSTKWFAKHSKSVISVEHDANWVSMLQNTLPANAKVIYKELIYGGEYSKEILNHNKLFHFVIVDGRDRVNCLKRAMEALTPDGVILFDNAEQERYRAGIESALNCGFKKIEFHGISPIAAHNTCTIIFYRNNNCFGI